jgi:hypothetical protein
MKDEDKVKYKVADPDIIPKLTSSEELSGLLNWALEGLVRLKKAKSFSYSKTTEQTQEMWMRKSDSFTAFIQDCIVLDYDKEMTKYEFQDMYKNYCKFYKVKSENLAYQKKILTEEYGIWDERNSSDMKRVWKGIKIRPIIPGIPGIPPFLHLYLNFKFSNRYEMGGISGMPGKNTQNTLKDATEIHNDVYLDDEIDDTHTNERSE